MVPKMAMKPKNSPGLDMVRPKAASILPKSFAACGSSPAMAAISEPLAGQPHTDDHQQQPAGDHQRPGIGRRCRCDDPADAIGGGRGIEHIGEHGPEADQEGRHRSRAGWRCG